MELQAENARLKAELAASERRQREILDSSVDFAIVVTDRGGRVTDWNAGAERILGWTAKEMSGETVERIFTPKDRDAGRLESEMRQALATGRAGDERWHMRADGGRFFASGELMPLRGADDAHAGFVKIFRDRTEEHRAGAALRHTQESLRRAQEVGGVGLFAISLPDGDLEPTPEFCRLYGLPVREAYPTAVIEALVLPQDAALVSTHEGRRRGEIERDVEYRIRRADTGEVRWIARSGDVERDEAGRPVVFSGVVRDVTEQRAAQAALQASEAHWRGLFEKLDEGLILGKVVRGEDGRVVDWRYLSVNPAWSRMVGFLGSPEGRTVREVIPGIEDAWIDQMAAAVETGQPGTFLRQVGPLQRWYEGRVYRTDADRFAVTFADVTTRREDERRRTAIQRLSDRLRDEPDPAAMAMIGSEAIGRTLGIDRVGYGTLGADGEGFTVEEDWTAPGFPTLAGRYRLDDYGRYAVDLREGRTVVIDDVREDPRTVDTAATLEAVSARALVNVPLVERGRTVAILYLNCGEPRAWSEGDVGFARDVAERLRLATERRKAERDLQALTASLETLVEERTRERDRFWRLSRDPFLVADSAGRWLAVSPAWTDILGWPEAELLGRTSEWMEHPDDRAKTRAEADAIARGGVTLRFENRFRTRDGAYRWFSWTAVPTEDGLLYAVARDVTEQKVQAETQAELEEQLRQSQKMEAVGQLTGGLAHDFNNLLTGISGSLELLGTRIRQGRFGEVERYTAAAQGAAQRAAALTHRLLAFSRRQTLDPKPTDANRLVAGLEDLIRRTVGPSIHLETVAAVSLWPTLVDPGQLENALLNLCINARDAMPEGGRITVETANRWMDRNAADTHGVPAGQYISLCVSDTGTGMTPEVIARAFEPFFTTKPLGTGTGLGLSMIYGFARQSGGHVRIYSEVGQGTNVCLYLPRHAGDLAAVDAVAGRGAAPRAGAGETVLVVDDEPSVRMLVTDTLEDLGYDAVEAADGPSGLRVLRSDVRIDLLVTDVGLPGGMNGRQMADAARVHRPDLKVLFITGYAENAVVGNGQLDRGMHVMTKPFAMEALASRIRELING